MPQLQNSWICKGVKYISYAHWANVHYVINMEMC